MAEGSDDKGATGGEGGDKSPRSGQKFREKRGYGAGEAPRDEIPNPGNQGSGADQGNKHGDGSDFEAGSKSDSGSEGGSNPSGD